MTVTDFLEHMILVHCTAISLGGTRLSVAHMLSLPFFILKELADWIEDCRVMVAVDVPPQSFLNTPFYWGKVLQM